MTPPLFSATLASMGYPGGKSGSGVYQALINLMPPHEVYVEPFLGGGAVMRYKRPAGMNIGIDLDPDVIARWASGPASGSGDARAGGAAVDRPAPNSATRDRRSPKLTTGPGHHQSADPTSPAEATSADAGEIGDSTRLKFLVTDGIEWLRSADLPRNALVYCDPPYLHSTRVCTRHYRHEMTDQQHGQLLEVIRGLKCRVMISGYSSPMYAKQLRGWNATAFQAGTRGKPAAEWVWYNFERPVELHDYRYLGNSRRDRERIRRKQARWVNRLRVMPTLERQALLSAIAETAGSGGASSLAAGVAVFAG